MVSLYGASLSYQDQKQGAAIGARLPTQLAGVSVLVDGRPAPLLFASAGQVNFLIPSDEITGDIKVQLVRQSIFGPPVTLTLAAAAPALFAIGGYALAQDYNHNYAGVATDSPAHSGDMIVLYATGLGYTQPNPQPGEIPATAANIRNLDTLKVLLNGTAVDSTLVKYAGLTPGSAGLYQINFILPDGLSADAEIRVSVAGQTSAAGVKLAIR